MRPGSFLEKAAIRFEQMPQNDRRALLLLSAFFVVCIAYLALSASSRFRAEAVDHFVDVRTNSAWMYANIRPVKALTGSASRMAYKGADDSLITVASSTAKEFSLALKRFQPDGAEGLRLSLEGANFNQMLLWLNKLEKEYGVNVKHISVEKEAKRPGMVDVSLSLVRL